MNSLEVATASGVVRGARESNGVRVWRGLPFAAAPIGSKRFRKPEAHSGWTGVRDASSFGPICPQPPLAGQAPTELMDEDCLTLNIWSPGGNQVGRPVIVWIHGGAYYVGSGSNPRYNASRLCAATDVVVVTINYRLGHLGYLDLSGLEGADGQFDTNLGMRDQIAALKWIKENIHGFGGDPDRVTIAGQSAGGGSVACLMASPLARGLFQAAIAQSPPIDGVFDRPQASQVTQAFLRALGKDAATFGDIVGISTETVLAASEVLVAGLAHEMPGHTAYQPIIDGEVLLDRPTESIRAGIGAGCPLIIGSVEDEGSLFALPGMPPLIPAVAPNAEVFVRTTHPETADMILQSYEGRGRFGRDVALGGDGMVSMPALRFADAVAQRHPVFVYRFRWTSPTLMKARLGSPHGVDVAFTFGVFDAGGVVTLAGSDADQIIGVSTDLQQAWGTFAWTGEPGLIAGHSWAPYQGQTRPTFVFDTPPGLETDPGSAQRLAWIA